MDQCEQIAQDYHFGRCTRDTAYTHLVAMGVDPHDAANALDAAAPDTKTEALLDA